MLKKIIKYINPIEHLGKKKYSFFFPLAVNILLVIFSEAYAYGIVKNPMAVGVYIIIINFALIIYFSFRDGLKGGFISILVTILYYAYIIDTRHYTGDQLSSGVVATIVLSILYIFLVLSIGGLKQKIDSLIENESDEKNRIAAIVQQLPTGIIITNSTGKVIQVNEKMHEILGNRIPIGHVVGKDTPFIPSEQTVKSISSMQSPLYQAFKFGKTQLGKEFKIVQPNGKSKNIQISASPVYNNSNRLIAAVSMFIDITAQKELESRKDNFMSMASHELKTPLTSALVFSQVVKRQFSKRKYRETSVLLDKLDSQLQKLSLLVHDLLDTTRMQKGKLALKKEKFRVKDLVKEVAEELRLVSEHELTLDWHTVHPVYGDKERIRQVLSNLITNAIKYSPEDSKIIIASQKKGQYLQVSVQDFGIGIDTKDQKKIFERFYQAGDYSTYPGLGLGLFISSEIIKQHGGKMWVESKNGNGSTFFFTIPIAH